MIRISTKGRYGVRLMLDLALHYGEGPILLREVAERQRVSEKYLGQLIIPLKTAGLLFSSRGAHGGYLLSKPPEKITLKNIVETLEGTISLVECVQAPEICNLSSECAVRDVWAAVGKEVADYLDSITLADMVKLEKKKRRTAGASKK